MNRIAVLPRLIAILVLVLVVAPMGAVSAIPDDPIPLDPCERPKPPPYCFAGSPTGTLTALSRAPAGIAASGSAQDPDASGPVRIAINVDGRFVGELLASGPGGTFSGTVPPRAGSKVCVQAINRNEGEDALLGCRRLEVRVDPLGHLDDVTTTSAGLRVRGWAIDPDTTAPVQVRLLVDGRQRQEILAAANRPDVGAAYPGYGNAHGFDVTLPKPKRHSRVCASGVNVGPGVFNTTVGCGRDPHAVSVLNLNLQGTNTDYPNDDFSEDIHIPWRDRYRRIARWMDIYGTLPDLITLQEVPARKQYWLPPLHDPSDYESLFVLIDEIKLRTGANYRIAYLSADYVQEGWQPLYQGRAMIYNADRIRNTTLLVNSWPAAHNDTTRIGVHMRTSWPCDHPPSNTAASCDLIDFEGRHWVSAHVNPSTGSWARGPQAAIFELISDPGKHIIVINVHAHPDTDPADYPSIQTLADEISRLWAPRTKLMPPIIAGDFNGEASVTGFDTTITGGIDYILRGSSSAHTSVYDPAAETEGYPTPRNYPNSQETICGRPATYLSDHCAFFAQYLPETLPPS